VRDRSKHEVKQIARPDGRRGTPKSSKITIELYLDLKEKSLKII
jgi:hypothetical protein